MKVGYARVSTSDQKDALEHQIARLRNSGAREVLWDIGSGGDDDRANFQALINRCKKKQVSEILITRIDRLSRSIATIIKIREIFAKHQVKLTILDTPIDDTDNPFSDFLLNQISSLGEFERKLIVYRIEKGFEHMRSENKAPGKVPFGYKRENDRCVPDDTLVGNKTKWAIASEIIDYLIANSASIRGTCHWIQQTYGIRWSTTGFQNWLRNPVLRGHIRYNVRNLQHHPEKWDIRYNTHQALISPEKDAQIKELMAENKRRWGANRNQGNRGKSPLSGQIYCGCCDGKCYVSRKDKDLLVCAKRNVYGKSYCSNKHATQLSKVIELVDIELTKRSQELRDFAFNENMPDSPELIELKASLENLEKLPPNEFINSAIIGLKEKIKDIQLQKNTPNLQLIDEWVEIFSDLRFFRLLPTDKKALLYRRFVRKVVIANTEVVDIELVDIF